MGKRAFLEKKNKRKDKLAKGMLLTVSPPFFLFLQLLESSKS